jgi:hypothetical protein
MQDVGSGQLARPDVLDGMRKGATIGLGVTDVPGGIDMLGLDIVRNNVKGAEDGKHARIGIGQDADQGRSRQLAEGFEG